MMIVSPNLVGRRFLSKFIDRRQPQAGQGDLNFWRRPRSRATRLETTPRLKVYGNGGNFDREIVENAVKEILVDGEKTKRNDGVSE